MTKSFIRNYLISIITVILCILFSGVVVNYFTYYSLKDTVCTGIEKNTSLMLKELENGEPLEETVKLYSKELGMDIYFFDVNGQTLAKGSCNEKFYKHSKWDFEKSVQHEINPITNISHMEKYSVSFEPYEVCVASVMPYSSISVHTDKLVRIVVWITAIALIFINMVIFIYYLLSYRPKFNMKDGVVYENLNVPVPDKVLPEYEPVVEAYKQLVEKETSSELRMVELVSNISHELKTPLTVIKGFIGAIVDGTIEPEHRYTYLVKVLNESNRMQQIIKNMLNTANIESGQISLNVEQFNILDIISEVLFMFERNIEEKNVNIISIRYPEIIVLGDRILLHQVFYNLIENAVKFVDENGTITISTKYENKYINFCIRNTGKGIPQKDLVHVFDRFYKSDYSRSENPDGAGLGLSIVKRFVNQHKGNITISSVEGKYTQFVMRFPKSFIIKQ